MAQEQLSPSTPAKFCTGWGLGGYIDRSGNSGRLESRVLPPMLERCRRRSRRALSRHLKRPETLDSSPQSRLDSLHHAFEGKFR